MENSGNYGFMNPCQLLRDAVTALLKCLGFDPPPPPPPQPDPVDPPGDPSPTAAAASRRRHGRPGVSTGAPPGTNSTIQSS